MPDYTVEIHIARERLQAADQELSAALRERKAAQAQLDWLISQHIPWTAGTDPCRNKS